MDFMEFGDLNDICNDDTNDGRPRVEIRTSDYPSDRSLVEVATAKDLRAAEKEIAALRTEMHELKEKQEA